MDQTTFSSFEVTRIARITLRQLQWWDEQGVVQANFDGHARVYDFHKALAICVIAELRHKGISLQGIRPIINAVLRNLEVPYLVGSGRNLHPCVTSLEVVAALRAARKPCFLIPVVELADKLRAFKKVA